MAVTIAKYYSDELAEWKRIIASYTHEIDDFEVKTPGSNSTEYHTCYRIDGRSASAEAKPGVR